MKDQWHFEFHTWKEAFEMFYQKHAWDKTFWFVISTDPHTSGYWIEREARPSATTKVYRTLKAVKALEARVKAKRESTVAASLGVVI